MDWDDIGTEKKLSKVRKNMKSMILVNQMSKFILKTKR